MVLLIVDSLDTIVSILVYLVRALQSVYIVPGVSLLAFIVTVNLMIILIGAFILRA